MCGVTGAWQRVVRLAPIVIRNNAYDLKSLKSHSVTTPHPCIGSLEEKAGDEGQKITSIKMMLPTVAHRQPQRKKWVTQIQCLMSTIILRETANTMVMPSSIPAGAESGQNTFCNTHRNPRLIVVQGFRVQSLGYISTRVSYLFYSVGVLGLFHAIFEVDCLFVCICIRVFAFAQVRPPPA